MTLELPIERRQAILRLLQKVQSKPRCTICSFAKFLGSMGACYPTIPYSWLYTKLFKCAKVLALRDADDNYDAVFSLRALPLQFS